MTTSAPSSARRMAMPRPIPLLLPVTSTLRPRSRSLRVPTGAVSVELSMLQSFQRVRGGDFFHLLEMPASIHADGLAGDEVGLTEERDRLGDFGLTAPVADRGGFRDFVDFLLAHVRRRDDRTRGNGIDEDVVPCHLKGQRFREGDYTGLSDVVRRKPCVARSAAPNQPISKVDDAAGARRPHVRNGGVRAEKGRTKVDVQERKRT